MQIERSPDGANLRSQAIDLTAEKFIVRVPRNHPAAGYGVFVFVPPWQDARLPAGWGPVLDDAGVIFVAAAKSGNDENIFGRRIPLALLGAHNVIQRYSVDADRVYVGGFSGGARVAMRVALGYPDVFRGAVLNAGSDPVGTSQAVLPPDDLFARFQASSHIVYVTGMDDATNVTRDMGSRGSMNAWCVYGTETETIFRQGHDVAAAGALGRALARLDRRSPVDPAKLADCEDRIAGDMRKDFEAIGHAAERGDPHAAWKLLVMADARYGGLARPQIVELAQRIGGPH